MQLVSVICKTQAHALGSQSHNQFLTHLLIYSGYNNR